MKHLLLLILFCLASHFIQSQYCQLATVDGKAIEISERSLVILVNNMNCMGCFEDLSTICKKLKSTVSEFYVLFDTKLIQPYERYQKISEVEKNLHFKNVKFIFLELNSYAGYGEFNCPQCDLTRSPNIVLRINGQNLCQCNNSLFNDEANIVQIVKEIKMQFKSK